MGSTQGQQSQKGDFGTGQPAKLPQKLVSLETKTAQNKNPIRFMAMKGPRLCPLSFRKLLHKIR